MKIAFFCDTYVPTKNGIATSASTTADELRKRGHRVVIFAPRFTGYEDTDPDIIRFAAGHWFKAKDSRCLGLSPVALRPKLPFSFVAKSLMSFTSIHPSLWVE